MFTETDYDIKIGANYTTTEIAIDIQRCRLCNFNPSKSKPRSFAERIGRIFKRNRTVRILNWRTF